MRLVALPIFLLLLIPLVSGYAQAAPVSLPDDIVGVDGTNFNVNDTNITFNGINDQTVFYIQFFYLVDGYLKYQYSNHLFDDETGHYNTDTNTHIHSDNYTHFWWQYFYLLQDMNINLVRLGAFEENSMEKCMDAYYNHNDAWDYVFVPMLDMAELAGVYIDFCFGGGEATFNSADSGYDEYLTYMEDLMTEYADETSIAIWDLSNEPFTLALQASYWNSHGGYAGYISYRENISAYAQTIAGEHLITEDGFGNPSKGYGEDGWNDPFESSSFDVIDGHSYFSAEDDYLIENQASWRDNLGQPLIFGECAINAPIEWPYWWYWPWMHNISSENNISTVWMTLWDYPGYPVSESTFNTIPAIPYDDYIPTPLPEPVIPNPYAMNNAVTSISSMILIIGIACVVIAYIAKEHLGYKGLK